MEFLSDSGLSEKLIGERLGQGIGREREGVGVGCGGCILRDVRRLDIQKEENLGRREVVVLMVLENLRKISICKICCDVEGF